MLNQLVSFSVLSEYMYTNMFIHLNHRNKNVQLNITMKETIHRWHTNIQDDRNYKKISPNGYHIIKT